MTEQDILIMNSDSTHVDVELSFDNGINTIKNNKIYSESMSLIDSISDSESIVFGKCNISQFQVKVADFDGDIDGALMNVLLKFSNAELGTCEYNLGRYIVSDSERTSDKMFRIITAYDKMSLFNVDIANWYNYTLFPFEVVDNNLGWLPVNENGVVIDLTYSIAGEPQTSLDKNDDGAYYLNTNDGIVYVGYATYDESGEFASVEWRTYLQCEKNESYTESCNVTRTVNEILAMLCEYVGVTYNTDFVLVNGGVVVKRDFNPQSLNGLDFLQQICELNGVFGHINNNGIFDFISPDKSTKQTVDTFKKCDYSDYTVQPINSVSIKYDSNDMGTAVTRSGIEKLNQYEIVGNIFLQSIKTEDELKTIAGNILSVIENVSYIPCSIEVKGGLSLELGDYITVKANTIKEESVSNVSFDTLVLYRNISGIQSIFNRIEAKGTEYISKSTESLASQLQITNKTIDKLYKEYTANAANFMYLYSKAITTDSLTANIANIGTLNANSAFVKFLQTNVVDANYIRAVTAEIGYLTADSAIISSLQTDKLNTSDLNAENAKLGYLTAGSAVITGKLDANQLSAEVAKLGYLDTKMANIDFANLNKANIGQLFANVGLISSATITDGHVTGYLDSVEVNANKITAGTLAVDRLLIKDSSGNYKMATYDSSGNLVTTTVNGSVITNRTITADHLVAGTITANEINMTNLVGNSAFINAINTNSIVVSASNNASSALSAANNANTKAQGIIDNIYTPNTTTIDGGKITTNSIKAAQIDVNDLFAQNITATGTITGATLKGANVEATSGSIGNWSIKNGSIVNEVTENNITKRTEFNANTNLIFETRNGTDNPATTITGDNIISGNSVSKTTISPNEIKTVLTAVSGQPYSSITPETIYENGTALSNKYAPISHSHDYLPLSGGTITGNLYAMSYIAGENVDSSAHNHALLMGHGGQNYWNFYEYGGVYNFYKSQGNVDTLLGKITINGWEGNVVGNVTGNAATATKATQDGNGNVISSTYIPNFGSNPTYGNGSALTQPAGEAALSIRTTTGASDVGIFYLSQDNCYIANSSDDSYTFGVFDTDLTKNMADVNAASFVVLSNGTGAKIRGQEVIHSGNIGDQSVNYANSSGTMQGSYTYNGGQQNPNYFGVNKIGALMMNTPINGDSHYKDFLIMDCYNGYDVGGATAIGVDRQEMRAFIMGSDAVRTSWTRSAELITTSNIGSQSVNYANSAGSAQASDVYSWAKQSTKPSYALNEISGSSDIFKVVTYSYNSVTIASTSSAIVTPSRTNIPSGYTPVAVYTVNSGGGRIYPRAHSADGTIVLVNESSSATVTPSMKVLCVKSNCVG